MEEKTQKEPESLGVFNAEVDPSTNTQIDAQWILFFWALSRRLCRYYVGFLD